MHAWIGNTAAPDGYVFDAPAIVLFLFPSGRCRNPQVLYSRDLEIDSPQLRPERSVGDHRHPRGDLDQPPTPAVGRRRPGATLSRRRDHRVPLDGDPLRDQLRPPDAPRHRGAPARRATAPVTPRRPRQSCVRPRLTGVATHRRDRRSLARTAPRPSYSTVLPRTRSIISPAQNAPIAPSCIDRHERPFTLSARAQTTSRGWNRLLPRAIYSLRYVIAISEPRISMHSATPASRLRPSMRTNYRTVNARHPPHSSHFPVMYAPFFDSSHPIIRLP